MKKLLLVAITTLLLSFSGIVSADSAYTAIGDTASTEASFGPEDVSASVHCVVKDITVLAKSDYECKAIGGNTSKSYKEGNK